MKLKVISKEYFLHSMEKNEKNNEDKNQTKGKL